MREFSIDSKQPQLGLKYSNMEVGSGHHNQVLSHVD